MNSTKSTLSKVLTLLAFALIVTQTIRNGAYVNIATWSFASCIFIFLAALSEEAAKQEHYTERYNDSKIQQLLTVAFCSVTIAALGFVIDPFNVLQELIKTREAVMTLTILLVLMFAKIFKMSSSIHNGFVMGATLVMSVQELNIGHLTLFIFWMTLMIAFLMEMNKKTAVVQIWGCFTSFLLAFYNLYFLL